MSGERRVRDVPMHVRQLRDVRERELEDAVVDRREPRGGGARDESCKRGNLPERMARAGGLRGEERVARTRACSPPMSVISVQSQSERGAPRLLHVGGHMRAPARDPLLARGPYMRDNALFEMGGGSARARICGIRNTT